MSIKLKPETERLVEEKLRSGRFHTIDEMIVQVLQSWREKNRNSQTPEERRLAVARMQEFVEKNRTSLEGLSIKELIHEGHRL